MSVDVAVREDPAAHSTLRALVVDDEAPAREELAYLLGNDPRVESVCTAGGAGQALRILGEERVDVVFCDIKMPGLDGVELARIVEQFAVRPHIVFVTAYDDRAVDAFNLQATDYLLKPVRAERLAEAVRRVVTAGVDVHADEDETVVVELAGVTRFVLRSAIRYVEAHGDYTRLHTASDAHLLRCTLAELEQRWAGAGFVRIHRSSLVALAHIDEVRVVEGRTTLRIGPDELPVSRRHTRELRDSLAER